jgi:hypothetical protein
MHDDTQGMSAGHGIPVAEVTSKQVKVCIGVCQQLMMRLQAMRQHRGTDHC